MSTPELEQAIAAARWRGAEENFMEAIAKMLETRPEVVARVVFAWETMKQLRLADPIEGQMGILRGGLDYGGNLPAETRRAIVHVAARAFQCMAIRWRMERGLFLKVPFTKLVPADKPYRICEGCPHQLECVRDLLSTPQACLRGERVLPKDQPDPNKLRSFQHRHASVKATKLEGSIVTVTADHPRGTFCVSVMDVLV